MKYFLIGIDGAQKELFSRFNLPFIQENLSIGASINLEEDLIGRGWSEMCTGVHASVSGAFYERMLMDGTYSVSTKYRLIDECKSNKNIIPLWDLLNSNGLSVGIMNIPTTNIAPKVNGFFVSGGGGGAKIISDIEDRQCYPKNIKSLLVKNNYIVDERAPTLLFENKNTDIDNFFPRLKLMNEKRVDTYLKLNKKFNVDFGFIVFRSIVVIENIFSAEIDRFLKGDKSVNIDMISKLRDFYLHFDSCLEKLCKGVNAQKIGFVSDHGTTPKYNLVNINYFLKRLGYQNDAVHLKSYLYYLKSIKRYIPQSIKRILKGNSSIMSAYSSIVNFDKSTSILFNINLGTSSSGVYVNDRNRFNGCVDPNNIKNIIDKFIIEFNSFHISKKHNLVAVDCSAKKNGKYGKYYPDILIKIPEGYQAENPNEVCSNDFVTPSYNSLNPVLLKNVNHDLWTGTKGRKPLATFLNHEFLNDKLLTYHDLTSVYHIVRKEFIL